MEEFRSTDILDKEIASDARRKAERILQRADADGKALLDGVALRIASSRQEMEKQLKERVAAYKKNAEASIPLEKERFRVSFTQKAISDAMTAFIADLGKDKLLAFVMERYDRVKDILNGKTFDVKITGLDENKTKKALEDAGVNIKRCKHSDAANVLDTGIILECEEVKASLTVAQIVSDIEDDKRMELAASLLKDVWGHE